MLQAVGKLNIGVTPKADRDDAGHQFNNLMEIYLAWTQMWPCRHPSGSLLLVLMKHIKSLDCQLASIYRTSFHQKCRLPAK